MHSSVWDDEKIPTLGTFCGLEWNTPKDEEDRKQTAPVTWHLGPSFRTGKWDTPRNYLWVLIWIKKLGIKGLQQCPAHREGSKVCHAPMPFPALGSTTQTRV